MAQIAEEYGTVVLPQNPKTGYFQRGYRNRPIPLTLLEVEDDYILVQIHNLHNTVKRLFYRAK